MSEKLPANHGLEIYQLYNLFIHAKP